MADKEVERNVRSTTVEGIRTPTERHVHGIGEKHTVSFGKRSQATKARDVLLDKFRSRERKRKATPSESAEKDENREPGGTGD